MSAARTPMTLGDLVHVRVDGHNEPIAMLPIVTAERMNAGSGIALVAYRHPDDRAMAQCMAAAPELKALAEGFEVFGPDCDGLMWLVVSGGSDDDRALICLGRSDTIAGRVLRQLESDRRAAIAKATGGAQ